MWLSNAPVGSSARITRRIAHQCPGDGYPLLLAAGKLAGLVFQLIAQANLLQRSLGKGMALCPGNTGVNQRDLYVFQKVQLGQKVVLLKDEPQLFVADGGQLVAGHLPHIPAVQSVGPIRGHIQAADDVHAGGFARAGLPHDGHKLAPVEST